MNWEQLEQLGEKFGWAIVAVVLLGIALHKEIFTLGRETGAVRKELERHRTEIEAERTRHRLEMEAERQRQREEIERIQERHGFAVSKWEAMADANNVLLRDAQAQLSRATGIAENLADKLAQLLTRDKA